ASHFPPRTDLRRQPLRTGQTQSAYETSPSFTRTYRKNVGNNSVAICRLQTRAMRHVVQNPRPIFARIFPDRRDRVTFNAATNKKHSSAFQLRNVFRYRFNWRRVVARFATDEK